MKSVTKTPYTKMLNWRNSFLCRERKIVFSWDFEPDWCCCCFCILHFFPLEFIHSVSFASSKLEQRRMNANRNDIFFLSCVACVQLFCFVWEKWAYKSKLAEHTRNIWIADQANGTVVWVSFLGILSVHFNLSFQRFFLSKCKRITLAVPATVRTWII